MKTLQPPGGYNIRTCESSKHLHRVIQKIKALGKRAAVALNPATSISTLDYIITDIDMVLLMTVNPGFGGQGYINTMTLKIRELRDAVRAMGLNIDIEIDGGITPDNIREVTEAGANVIVAGSAVFKAADRHSVKNSGIGLCNGKNSPQRMGVYIPFYLPDALLFLVRCCNQRLNCCI